MCNFDFVLFWLGIQYDSIEWVIMRRRGVSSERNFMLQLLLEYDEITTKHYSYVIMSAMASRWFVQLFVQVQMQENTKAPRHWPLWGEFTDDRWIPLTKVQ